MILRHKFTNKYYIQTNIKYVNEATERLVMDDYCIYCGLIIDRKLEGLSTMFEYKFEHFNYLNENYKCLTEEEYIIKKLLE
jgi:hypothetical protein